MNIDHIVEGVDSTVAIDTDTPAGERRASSRLALALIH
jgi:hypothetical protein